jgi:hypothetical protein
MILFFPFIAISFFAPFFLSFELPVGVAGALMRTNRPDRESGRSNGQHDYGDYDEREVGVRHRQCTALDGNSIRASSKPSRSNDCSAIGDGNRFQKRLTVGRAKRLSGAHDVR